MHMTHAEKIDILERWRKETLREDFAEEHEARQAEPHELAQWIGDKKAKKEVCCE